MRVRRRVSRKAGRVRDHHEKVTDSKVYPDKGAGFSRES